MSALERVKRWLAAKSYASVREDDLREVVALAERSVAACEANARNVRAKFEARTQLATEREAHARTLEALKWALDELEAHGLDPDEWSQDAVTARWRGEEKARAAIAAAKVTP